MNDFLKQDIFFFVTTIAVIVVGTLLVVLSVYVIKIFRDLKYISGKAKMEADLLSEDIADLRQNVRKGMKLKSLISFFSNLNRKRKE